MRDWLSLGLAAAGVLILSGAQWSAEAAGVLFALGAAALWAGYIVVGHRVSGSANSLAVGFVLSAALTAPLAWMLWPGVHLIRRQRPRARSHHHFGLGRWVGGLECSDSV